MSRERIGSFVVLILLIGGAIYYFESQKSERAGRDTGGSEIIISGASKEEKKKQFEHAKEISTPNGFINTPSEGITISELVGKKVILVDFWTYSCINCQRTQPYLNAWYEKYHDQGLEIIGIHTPEFEFEKKYENVKRAVEEANIHYPVVLDNDFSTWQAYENRFWPRKYLIDIDGFIVYDHIGEGAYDETERKIQELLKERGEDLNMQSSVSQEIVKPAGTNIRDAQKPQTPEIYFGAWRNEYLGNGERGIIGHQSFSLPENLLGNVLYMVGDWVIGERHAINTRQNDRIILGYEAQNVFMVAGSDSPVRITVVRDGKVVEDAISGEDIRNGEGVIKEERLYKIIEDPAGWGQHMLEIIIEGEGLRAFTFTFG